MIILIHCKSVAISAFILLILMGCTKKPQDSAVQQLKSSPGAAHPPALTSIKIHGALREIMHMGRTERRVDLAPLIGKKGLFGLGALENLSGEVTLWDGQLWLSTPDGHGAALSGQHKTTTAGATLLVTSVVAAWQERSINRSIPFDQLDAFIKQEALAAGVNVEEAFPFRIEGTPLRLNWHVIDGSKIPADAHGHEAHIRTAVRGKLDGKPVRIIGFYSPKHHTIFTHHDSNTHAHVISDTPLITGHVDHIVINSGSRLFLPAQ